MKRRERATGRGGMYTGEVIKGLSPTIEKEGIEPPQLGFLQLSIILSKSHEVLFFIKALQMTKNR